MVFKPKHYVSLKRRRVFPQSWSFSVIYSRVGLCSILIFCVSPYFSVTEKQVELGYVKTLGSQ